MTVEEIKQATLNAIDSQTDAVIMNISDISALLNRIRSLEELCDTQRERIKVLEEKAKYKVYATPRSVNTFGGVLKDINEDLPTDSEIYVVEMGARGAGDIKEISTFVNPHLAVVGKIGPAHIEYFGSLENIRNTKMEILSSNRLKEAWVHDSAMVKPEKNIHSFGKEIHDIEATLDGLAFKMDGDYYHANILGSFNAMNIAGAIKPLPKHFPMVSPCRHMYRTALRHS